MEFEPITVAMILTITLGLVFDFTNGFHDAANATATAIASKSLTPLQAIVLSAIFNAAPAIVGATAVANTVAKTVVLDQLPKLDSQIPTGMLVTFAALVAAIAWNLLTWKFGIPSSSSHALIGGLVGAGLGVGGIDVITWSSVGTVLIAIVASPAVAFALACGAMLLIIWLRRCSHNLTEDATVFRVLQVLATCWLSWAHGSNDAQKTMGVIAATLYAAGYLDATDSTKLVPPLWVVLAAQGAIATGTLFGGWAIIETMGMNITLITRASGCAANLGTIIAVEAATLLGIPVSTTQAAVAAVTASGFAARRSLGWAALKKMALAWLITLPCSLCLGAVVAQIARLPDPFDLVVGGVLLGALLVWGLVLAWSAKTMKDVAKRLPSDEALATGEDRAIEGEGLPNYGGTEGELTIGTIPGPSLWERVFGTRRKVVPAQTSF